MTLDTRYLPPTRGHEGNLADRQAYITRECAKLYAEQVAAFEAECAALGVDPRPASGEDPRVPVKLRLVGGKDLA